MTAPVTLKGGLDLRRSKPIVDPGRLLACKNYESTTDVEGYKPFDGFERFDGRMHPSTWDVWQVTVATAGITGTFTVGERLYIGGTAGVGVEFGVLVAIDSTDARTVLTFAYWPGAESLLIDDVIYGDTASVTYEQHYFIVLDADGNEYYVSSIVLDGDGNAFIVVGGTLSASGVSYSEKTESLEHITGYKTTPPDLYTELGVVATVLRALISGVPGNGPVLGIERFEQETYAVRNYFNIGFDGGGTTEPDIYQRILDASGNEGILHTKSLTSGDWGAGTAAGLLAIDGYDSAFAVADNDQLDLVGEIQFEGGSIEPSAGDVISGQTSGSTATVHRVRLDSGTFAGGDAAGVIYILGQSGAFTATELMDNDTAVSLDDFTCTEHTHDSENNFIDATATTANQAKAGMWKSSRTGWSRVDLGWEVGFDSGAVAPPAVDLGGDAASIAADAEDTGWLTGLSASQNTLGTRETWGTLSAANLQIDDGTEATATMTSYLKSQEVWVYNFPVNLEASDAPLGFEVEFRCRQSTAGSDGRFRAQLVKGSDKYYPDESTAVKTDTGYPLDTATEFTHTIGGSSDDWGGWSSGGVIAASDVNDSDFAVEFVVEAQGAAGTPVFNVDQVRIRITYLPAGAKVYFWDGVADVGSAVLTQDYVLTGSYGSAAAGTYSLADLTRYDFGSGTEIRTAAAGAGAVIATTTGAPTRVTLAGSTLVDAEESKYLMGEHNFFAADSLNALFGVSGAGLAFVYDGTHFRQIRSGVLEVNDKPRHFGMFQFRLILGYKWGEESWSTAGLPLVFDGTLNAVATGYGFRITGIKELSGQILGTFTTGGVFGTKVSGSDFDQQILVHDSKVIEYSVQDFGAETVFCDQNGIRALSTTDKYGDFEGGTLSRDVNKWLRKRLRKNPQISPRNGNFVNSTVIRSKGQYRMYFADGEVLTMTWDQIEDPEFTFQKLWLDDDETDAYARVLATSSGMDEDGTEHVYISVDERPDYDHSTDLSYVFQTEAGTSFDGDAIDGYATVSWLNVGDPVTNKRFTKWQLYGEAYNYATPTIDFAVNLGIPDGAGAETLKIGKSSSSSTLETNPFFTKPRSKKRGRNVAVRFDHNSSTELPHLLQLLVSVDESTGRKEV